MSTRASIELRAWVPRITLGGHLTSVPPTWACIDLITNVLPGPWVSPTYSCLERLSDHCHSTTAVGECAGSRDCLVQVPQGRDWPRNMQESHGGYNGRETTPHTCVGRGRALTQWWCRLYWGVLSQGENGKPQIQTQGKRAGMRKSVISANRAIHWRKSSMRCFKTCYLLSIFGLAIRSTGAAISTACKTKWGEKKPYAYFTTL